MLLLCVHGTSIAGMRRKNQPTLRSLDDYEYWEQVDLCVYLFASQTTPHSEQVAC